MTYHTEVDRAWTLFLGVGSSHTTSCWRLSFGNYGYWLDTGEQPLKPAHVCISTRVSVSVVA